MLDPKVPSNTGPAERFSKWGGGGGEGVGGGCSHGRELFHFST